MHMISRDRDHSEGRWMGVNCCLEQFRKFIEFGIAIRPKKVGNVTCIVLHIVTIHEYWSYFQASGTTLDGDQWTWYTFLYVQKCYAELQQNLLTTDYPSHIAVFLRRLMLGFLPNNP